MFLGSSNLLFNPKIVIPWVRTTTVQYNTILSKKDQNYFEVMINYIIAVTSSVRRNNVMPLCSCSCQFPFHRWYYLHYAFILDWLFVWVHSWTQTFCTKQSVSDLHWPAFALTTMILHSFHLYKQVDNKFEWERKNLFVFYIWQSWAVLHCWITLPLQRIYLVGIVWLFQ